MTDQDSASGAATIVRLAELLKRRGLVGTGGEAKIRIQGGEVTVNGIVETRRRKQLLVGDRVQYGEMVVEVTRGDVLGTE